MPRPDTRIRIAFDLAAGGVGDFFTLDDPVKGELDGTTYKLAGDILEDVTDDVQAVTVRRGRSRELERYQAGAVTVDLDNSGRKYDPAAGTAITPYGASMRPRKAVTITADGYPVFAGVVDDWDLVYDLGGGHVASVKATDGFVFLANEQIDGHTTTSQLSGARISAILDRSEIDWPDAKRAIGTGIVTLQADTIEDGQNALEYLKKVDEAEQGALFMASDGRLTFRDRSNLQILTSTVFADDGSGIPFAAIDASYGSEELRNRIKVTRLNGGTATAIGTASVTAYGAIDFELTDTLLNSDADAQDLADVILARYEEPILRIDGVVINTREISSSQLDEVLALELGDLVTVKYTPSGIGDTIDQYVRLDSIEHAISAVDHRIRLDFSRAEGLALVLDDEDFGILDENTLGY